MRCAALASILICLLCCAPLTGSELYDITVVGPPGTVGLALE